jgi:peptidoglycan hydrolase-like protein with peptidoglycan-binding domain
MERSRSWLKSAFVGAGTAVVAGCLAFGQTTSASGKSASTHKPVASKSKGKTAASTHQATKSQSARSRTTSTRTTSHKGKRSKKVKGQQKIDGERTHQIQEALIRQHYMTGEPNGKWDASTEEALRRFQADNGWQNKTVPDSRALIKLGLGPSHDHLLNPESAMTTTPEAPHTTATPASAPPQNDSSAAPNQPQR